MQESDIPPMEVTPVFGLKPWQMPGNLENGRPGYQTCLSTKQYNIILLYRSKYYSRKYMILIYCRLSSCLDMFETPLQNIELFFQSLFSFSVSFFQIYCSLGQVLFVHAVIYALMHKLTCNTRDRGWQYSETDKIPR